MTPKQRKEIERRAHGTNMAIDAGRFSKEMISELREDVRVVLKALDEQTKQKEMWESRSRVLSDRLEVESNRDTDLLT